MPHLLRDPCFLIDQSPFFSMLSGIYIKYPPSQVMQAPVVKDDASDTGYGTTPAISSGVAASKHFLQI